MDTLSIKVSPATRFHDSKGVSNKHYVDVWIGDIYTGTLKVPIRFEVSEVIKALEFRGHAHNPIAESAEEVRKAAILLETRLQEYLDRGGK